MAELSEVLRALEGLRAEVVALRGAMSGAAAAGADPPPEQMVTLDQCAAIVHLRKRSLERYRGKMPGPRLRGRGGRASRWAWSEVRPWLEAEFGRKLPEIFPGCAAP